MNREREKRTGKQIGESVTRPRNDGNFSNSFRFDRFDASSKVTTVRRRPFPLLLPPRVNGMDQTATRNVMASPFFTYKRKWVMMTKRDRKGNVLKKKKKKWEKKRRDERR